MKRFVALPLTFDKSQSINCRAAYLEQGSGPPLLMLHGFMGEATCWLPLMQRLSSHFQCISLDLLGFGESAKPAIRYSVATEVSFVHQFLDQLELKQCYVLGHSFGSWVASAYALKFPNVLTGMILAAPAGIRDEGFRDRHNIFRPLLWQNPLIDWAISLGTPLALRAGKQAEFERIRWFRANIINQPVARSFLLSRLRGEKGVETVEKQIHQLQIPTLVITGDRDDTIPLWHSQTYAQEIPNAKLAIIPGADHALPQRYAEEMATLIQEFLAVFEPRQDSL